MIQTLQRPSPWRFWAAIALQLFLIATLTVPPLLTYLNGTTVILQTAPVDPYDLLRGYSQTLRYDISNPQILLSLPGGQFLDPLPPAKTPVYLTLEPLHRAASVPPKPWQAIAVSAELPVNLAADRVVLRGAIASDRRVHYGLESYYFPEGQQTSINAEIRAATDAGNRSSSPLRIEARVDRRGTAVPVALWIGDRRHQF